MMDVKIRKIGNSLGILLPKDALDLLGLKDGDTIKINTKGRKINLTLEKKER